MSRPTRTRARSLTLSLALAGTALALRIAPAAAQTAPAAPARSGHATSAMSASAMRDSSEAFLRMFVSHHEGLIRMTEDSLRARAAKAGTKADARKLHTDQAREQRQMQAMLRRMGADSAQHTVMPSNQAMLDTLGRTPAGPEFDRTFYRLVVAHHREGVEMIDKQLPHLTADVRRMAARMRATQQREIAEFERKMRAS